MEKKTNVVQLELNPSTVSNQSLGITVGSRMVTDMVKFSSLNQEMDRLNKWCGRMDEPEKKTAGWNVDNQQAKLLKLRKKVPKYYKPDMEDVELDSELGCDDTSMGINEALLLMNARADEEEEEELLTQRCDEDELEKDFYSYEEDSEDDYCDEEKLDEECCEECCEDEGLDDECCEEEDFYSYEGEDSVEEKCEEEEFDEECYENEDLEEEELECISGEEHFDKGDYEEGIDEEECEEEEYHEEEESYDELCEEEEVFEGLEVGGCAVRELCEMKKLVPNEILQARRYEDEDDLDGFSLDTEGTAGSDVEESSNFDSPASRNLQVIFGLKKPLLPPILNTEDDHSISTVLAGVEKDTGLCFVRNTAGQILLKRKQEAGRIKCVPMMDKLERKLHFDPPEISTSLHRVKISIVAIDRDDRFTVKILDEKFEELYKSLQGLMSAYYGITHGDGSINIPESRIRVGMIVVVDVSEYLFGQFERGIVRGVEGRINGKTQWRVDCLDEAETVYVTHEDMHYIPEEFMKLPRRAFRCTLFGLEYVSGRGVIRDTFHEFLADQRINACELRANVFVFSHSVALELVSALLADETPINFFYQEFLYKLLSPVLNDVHQGATFLCADSHGRAAFRLEDGMSSLVVKLDPYYTSITRKLQAETMDTLMQDFFKNKIYLLLTKVEFDQAHIQRFTVVEILHRKNQVVAALVDSPEQITINIDNNILKSESIHRNLARLPPQFVSGKIYGIPDDVSFHQVCSYLNSKDLRVTKVHSPGKRTPDEIEVLVKEPANPESKYLTTSEWVQHLKLQDFLKTF